MRKLNDVVVGMVVDMKQRRVFFLVDGEAVAYTHVTDYLMGKRMGVYVGCRHAGDMFMMNAE